METILNPNWNKLAVFTFAVGALTCPMVVQAPLLTHPAFELPQLQVETQMVQVKELLSRAPSSLAEGGDGRGFIYDTLAKHLPAAYQSSAAEIALTLISESNRYHLDPIFLLAVIQTESHFNPLAHGRHGDLGLMQLLPKTGQWMAARLKMKGRIDLRDPILNIKIGAAYFAFLRQHFGSKGSRYLAAYNMGIRNVHRLLKEDKEPMVYASRVLKNYRALYAQFAASGPAQKNTIASN
jgi:soluble lytic murein transglycosylase